MSTPNGSNPFFSVVIPAFNAARFLGEALECVRRQTFGDFECIVVDDGSTDATPAIAASFERDSRFHSMRIAHGASPGRARNHGIREASGEYVALLDADDLWTGDKLERYFKHIQSTAATLVFSNGYVVDDRGRQISLLLSPRMKPHIPVGDPFMVVTNAIPVASVVVNRSVIAETPFAEDPDIRGAEDYLLWLDLNAEHALEYVSDPLLLYRCHTGQMHRDYLEQLRKWEKILGTPTIARTYGQGTVDLTRSLIDFRRQYARQDYGAALREALGLTRWLVTPQRATLLYYLRFGLLQRTKTLARQRLKGSLVGV